MTPTDDATATLGDPTVREFLDNRDLQLTLAVDRQPLPEGLDRQVRWVHSTELVGAPEYLRGGELVCTVGTSLLTDDACARFVETLAECGAAGICFGLGDVHQQTPRALILECERHGLPLLALPRGVRFLRLSEFLADYRTVAHSELSARSERLIADLLAAIRSDASMNNLVDQAAERFGGRLTVSISDFAYSSGAAAEGSPERGASTEDATIVWTGDNEPPPAEVLAQVCRILELAWHEKETERVRQRERFGHLLSLVGDRMAGAAALLPYLQSAGLAEREMVVSAWPPHTAQVLAQAMPEALIGEASDVCFLIAVDEAVIVRLAHDLVLACGYGNAVGAAALGSGIAEARAALELARRHGRVVGPHQLTTLDGLLEQQPPRLLAPFVEQLIRPLTDHDERHRGDLEITLRRFLEQDGNLTRTANALFVHVNTVRHRLARVRELTGRDALQFADRAALTIALWAHGHHGHA